MKVCDSCQLFGAYEALAGIQDSVILLHSVTGCNFGTLSMNLTSHMHQVNQCCTVISDEDVIMGGEASIESALLSVWDLYQPKAVFVITGCVGSMIGDDVEGAIERAAIPCPVVSIQAAGFGGNLKQGYDRAAEALISFMEVPKESLRKRKKVNLIGFGAGDVRISADLKEWKKILPEDVELGMCLTGCQVEDIQKAGEASLNLMFGRGLPLAKKMEERYGIPYLELSYPYGLLGEAEVRNALHDLYDGKCQQIERGQTATESLKSVYAFLQNLYGSSVAVIGSKARAEGMRRFLEEELGMDVVCMGIREEMEDLEEFYDQLRQSEAGLLFGSSFETQIAKELEMPLIRFDYPVFDRVCITDRPYVGCAGVPFLVEDILNEIFKERKNDGALYQ